MKLFKRKNKKKDTPLVDFEAFEAKEEENEDTFIPSEISKDAKEKEDTPEEEVETDVQEFEFSDTLTLPTIGVSTNIEHLGEVDTIRDETHYHTLLNRMFNEEEFFIETSDVFILFDSRPIEDDFDLYKHYRYVMNYTPLSNDFETDGLLRKGALLNAYYSSFYLMLEHSLVHATIVEHELIDAPSGYELNVIFEGAVDEEMLKMVENIFFGILNVHGYILIEDDALNEAKESEEDETDEKNHSETVHTDIE